MRAFTIFQQCFPLQRRFRLGGSFLLLLIVAAGASCHKDNEDPGPAISRTVRYVLYTTKDFSGNTSNIDFTVSIKSGNKTIWDSALTRMRVEEIPDSTHAIVIEKQVSASVRGSLKVGFYYAIQNVGQSWWLDECRATDSLKEIAFPFQ